MKFRGGARLSALSLALALLAILSCQSSRVQPVRPVDTRATQALLAAQRASRADDLVTARAELTRALELEPDWVAPRRFLDEMARAELRGVEALAEHLATLAVDPGDARSLYLAGRLEGQDGRARFEQAVRADPSLAWGHHGLSFAAGGRGDNKEALRHAQRALARARDSWERTFFTASVARCLAQTRQRDRAMELLRERAASPEVEPEERLGLLVQAAQTGLEHSEARARAKNYQDALELLRTSDPSENEIEELVQRMRLFGGFEDPDGIGLSLALAMRSTPMRDRLRAELMLESGATPLALGLLERALSAQGRTPPPGTLMRAARFAAGEPGLAVERWLASLPRNVLDSEALPREPRLRRIVELARTLDDSATFADFGDALIRAGWFREARAFASKLAQRDLEGGLGLEARALAGIDLIESMRRSVRRIDSPRERKLRAPPANTQSGEVSVTIQFDQPGLEPIADLDGLLRSLVPAVSRARTLLGGERDPKRIETEILESPRMRYGGFAELVHPGPTFSLDDEAAGLGPAGTPVPGLAPLWNQIGRFALFGELSGGGGPDATVLPLLATEERSGEHLGVAWNGSIAWCEGADIKSRAGRRGAQISAAALHEGYWVDVDSVRGEKLGWDELRRKFSGAGAAERVQSVLATRGLAVGSDSNAAAARVRTGALLGEAHRVRLALLVERGAAQGERLGEITLEDLLEVTGVHEEGHLCDRTRFLPIGKHLGALLLFLLDCGFSPARVQEELEYRAQLTCLASSAEPRIALTQILDAAESGPSGLTPHATAYIRLLRDLVGVLERERASKSERWSMIDPDFTLVHQLHKLGPEDLRELAERLARKKLR